MTTVLRMIGALLLAVGGFALAGPAAAAPPVLTVVDECDGDPASYVPGEVCDLEVEVTPYCVEGLPYLGYSVEGEASGDVRLTWVNPGGDDVVLDGLPREGAALWPAGEWARPTVDVVVTLGADAVMTVTYPDCFGGGELPDGGEAPSGGELPAGGSAPGSGAQAGAADAAGGPAALSDTGASTAPLLGGAAGLLLLGAGAVAVAKRRTAAKG